MSTLKCNRIENTSTASGGLDVDSSGKVRITTLADSSGNNNSTPAEIASGRAKAWINFDGTTPVAIRASYNVASLTDNGVGDYTITFTTAMADTNYCVTESSGTTAGLGIFINTAATGSLRVSSKNYTGGSEDNGKQNVAIFR